MNTTTESLKNMYVKLGGKITDVEALTTIPEMLDAINTLLDGQGGGAAIVDGNWTYKVYSDGFFEAWYAKTNTRADIKNEKGGVWESDRIRIAFPENLTIANYDEIQVQLNVSGRLFGCWSNVYAVDATGIEYSVFSAIERGVQESMRVSVYATGRVAS